MPAQSGLVGNGGVLGACATVTTHGPTHVSSASRGLEPQPTNQANKAKQARGFEPLATNHTNKASQRVYKNGGFDVLDLPHERHHGNAGVRDDIEVDLFPCRDDQFNDG